MRLAPFLLLALLPATALAQSTSRAAPLTDSAVQSLLTDLANDDYSIRGDAQKRLDQFSYKQRELLLHLAAQATDEEVKARLAARLQAIDEQLALNPPPISLDLQDATLAQVAAALSRETGFVFESSSDESASRFTLHVTDQPFCEVLRQLCLQHPLAYDAGTRGPRLSEGANAMRDLFVQGSFAIAPLSIERQSSVDPQRQPPQKIPPATTTLTLHLIADPRVQVETMSTRLFDRIVDDQGKLLIDLQQLLTQDQLKVARSSGNDWRKTTDLTIPENPGTKIASAKGTLIIGVAVVLQNVTLDNLENCVNAAPLVVGGNAITLTQFSAMEKQIQFALTVVRPRDNSGKPPPPLPQAALIDANGLVLWKNSLTGSSLSASTAAPFTAPVHLEFSLPAKIREVPFSYEFKDLPLP
jgi:hypothetical protein